MWVYIIVTPHTGVWIETDEVRPLMKIGIVTPHTGVWIETSHLSLMCLHMSSHPPYGGVD